MNFLTNVFTTITFFLPGFLAKFASDYTEQTKDSSSEVKVTVLSIVWNIPSIFGGWALFAIVHGKLLTSSQFMKNVQSLPWMSAYFIFATAVDFIVGRFVLRQVKNRFSQNLNKARTEAGLPRISDGLPWEQFIGTDESSIVKMYLLGRSSEAIIGVLQAAYQPGDEQRGVALLPTEDWQQDPTILKNPSRIFVEFDSQMVFELFTLTDLEKLVSPLSQDSPLTVEDE